MRKEWVVSIREQCKEYGVPFFFKQWGGVRKTKNGRLLDGRTTTNIRIALRRRFPIELGASLLLNLSLRHSGQYFSRDR